MKYTIRKVASKNARLSSRKFTYWIYKGEKKQFGPYFNLIDAQTSLVDIKINSI